jgi:flagellar hook-length control protein FliK
MDPTHDLQTTKAAASAGAAPGSKPLTSAAAGGANRVTLGTANTSNASRSSDTDSSTAAANATPSDSDATTPTATVAAMSAAVSGVVSQASGSPRRSESSSTADDSAVPAAAVVAQDAGGLNPSAEAVPAFQVVSPAAATSAQAMSALASVSAADKHSRGVAGDSSPADTSSGGTAGVAQLSTNATTAADAAPTPTLKVAAAVDSPEFAQGVSDRVSWMVDNNLNGAKLQVNPPQLGPIEVRISVQGDQAQVWLTAHSAVTRDALESSSPKLREMLGTQGFAQVNVDVSQRSFQERPTFAQSYDWTPPSDRGTSAAPVSSAPTSVARAASGTLDAYA